jgi:hypothetical protein
MFEQEMKMEERSSSIGPILLIAAVCLTIVATTIYVIHEATKGMSQAEAKHAVTSMLASKGPAMLHFRTGLVAANAPDKPSVPLYKLLQAAQVITTEKKDGGTQVTLTEDGKKLLDGIAGTTHTTNVDGTEEYSVPLGKRELVAVTGVNVISPSAATVHYTWRWNPTAMGDVFDLAGGYVNGMDVWERAELAKDGADLFHSGPVQDDYNATSGWQMARN